MVRTKKPVRQVQNLNLSGISKPVYPDDEITSRHNHLYIEASDRIYSIHGFHTRLYYLDLLDAIIEEYPKASRKDEQHKNAIQRNRLNKHLDANPNVRKAVDDLMRKPDAAAIRSCIYRLERAEYESSKSPSFCRMKHHQLLEMRRADLGEVLYRDRKLKAAVRKIVPNKEIAKLEAAHQGILKEMYNRPKREREMPRFLRRNYFVWTMFHPNPIGSSCSVKPRPWDTHDIFGVPYKCVTEVSQISSTKVDGDQGTCVSLTHPGTRRHGG